MWEYDENYVGPHIIHLFPLKVLFRAPDKSPDSGESPSFHPLSQAHFLGLYQSE